MLNFAVKADGVGNKLTANEFNNYIDELENLVTNSGQVLSGADTNQMGKGVANYAGAGDFFTDSGTANAYILSAGALRQAPTAYVDGLRVRFIPANTNTGASTVNLNSLGVKNILNASNGSINKGIIVELIFNNSLNGFLINNIILNENNYVLYAVSNSTFISDTNNNPYGFFFDDGKARYGIERVHFLGLIEILDNDFMPKQDTNGKKGFHPVDAKTGKIRYDIGCYGNWLFDFSAVGLRIYTDTTGDYIIITNVFNKLNVLSTIADNTVRNTNNDIYLDGIYTTNNLNQQGSNVLSNIYFSTNNIQEAIINTTQGIHTVKIINGSDAVTTDRLSIYGFEIVNEANSVNSELCVPSCSMIIQGKQVNLPAHVGVNSLPLKGSSNNGGEILTGTKGGFVGYYIDKNGNYISKVQASEKEEQNGVIAYNGASSDSVTGLSDSSKFYANSQGNIVRIKDISNDDRLFIVPSNAPSATEITCANDYDGVGDTTLFQGNKQFKDDGSTGVTFSDTDPCVVELYCKVGVNSDHTDEELYSYKKYSKEKNKIIDESFTPHFADFGNQRSDDFSTFSYTIRDGAFTLPDGGTSLVAEDCNTGLDSVLQMKEADDFFTLTCFCSGLDVSGYADVSRSVETWIDGIKVMTTMLRTGITKICSGLPLGFHTFKFVNKEVIGVGFVDNFLIYRTKKKTLSENYEYSFLNYILADYIRTSIPTLNLSVYNGAIDQGVIRKAPSLEFVYTGSGTFNFGNVDTSLVVGRTIYLNANNDGNFKTVVFGSGFFRWWLKHSSNSDTVTITRTLNGTPTVLETAQALGNANINGRNNVNLTLNTEGVYTIDCERVTNTNGSLSNLALDYHAPVFNQFNNLANPFKDFIFGQNGVLDNRKLTNKDEKIEREICTESLILATGDNPLVYIGECSSFAEENIYASIGARCAGGTQSCRLFIDKGGLPIRETLSTLDATTHGYENMNTSLSKPNSKRTRKTAYLTGTNITFGVGNAVIKLEEK